MKVKTINKLLTAKFEQWRATLPESLQQQVKNNTVITGGSIVSMLMKEPVNDFDIYFKDMATTVAIANYYLGLMPNHVGAKVQVDEGRVRIVVAKGYRGETVGNVEDVAEAGGEVEDTYDQLEKEALEKTEKEPKYWPVFISTNAITLTDKIQIVIRFYGEPDQIHENYDFVHCTNYWTSWERKLILKPEALVSILTKELRYVGSRYPLCSLIRCRKFIQRGWSVNAGQMLKMIMQCNDLDLTDIKVLEDQLTGVDSAYFMEVIHKLAEKDPDKVNTAYLVEIIDRIF